MEEILAWAVFPLVALAACTGVGLLAERLAGLRLAPALLPGLGLCGAVVAVAPLFGAGVGAVPCAVLIAVLAFAGWVDARGEIGRLRPGAGALAGAAAYALYIAPVALGGEATFLGYNLLNDTSIHLALVDYLAEHGARLADLPPSSYAAAIDEYVGRSYPLGSHELLTALRAAVPLDPALLYQPFLAVTVAVAASALVALVLPGGGRAPLAALVALVAVASHLLFSFGLQGSIKELPFLAVLAVAAALGGRALTGPSPVRAAALAGLAAAALYAIYGLYALAWILPLLVLFALLARFALRIELREIGARVAAAGVVLLIGSAALIAPSIDYYSHHAVLEAQSELGPLGGPLRTIQIGGIWLAGDYRFTPPTSPGLSYLLNLFVVVAAAIGVRHALRAGRHGLVLLAGTLALAFAVGVPRGSPYADAKLMALLSPALLLAACAWLAASGRAVVVRRVALAGVVGAVAVSDALAYRIALPAPMDRLEELDAIGERFEGRGPVLVNEFEEYVKHFGRAGQLSGIYDRWNARRAELRPGVVLRAARDYRLDELAPAFVQAHRVLVTRRSPVEDQPPSNYSRAYRGRWYDAWERRGPAPAEHHPLGSRFSAVGLPHCGPLERLTGDGALAGLERPAAIRFDVAAQRPLPAGWYPNAAEPGSLDTAKGGSVAARGVTGAGVHEIWVRGRIVRRLAVFVDGRRVGEVRGLNRATQWTRAGSIRLTAGVHRVELRRPKRSLRPGDAATDTIGPALAVPATPARLVRTRTARRLCGRPLDWVDVAGR